MANKKKTGAGAALKDAPPEEAVEVQGEARAPADTAPPADEPAASDPSAPEASETAEVPETREAPETSEPAEAPETQDAGREPSETERELADWKEKYLRLAAEYDNYRKRTQRQRETLYADAVADTAERFLPVYDNLERALGNQTEDAAYYKGVELIQTGLLEVFAKMNVQPIEALGRPFDPTLHNAVIHTEDDSGEENVVAEVFQAGFIMDDRVIRHALVKVKN